MALSPGTRLGPYEVIAQIGEGGMGQAYRARDTKLNRDVALKILPGAFASDSDRLARFTREAQTLASLNHPNIAAIYGIEESRDVRALVMELVEGEDLAQRITRGAIPLDDALPIARQIAEALEAAHEQGIIHRDLKPANIKVRADGTVKVLDFGLAKLTQASGSGLQAPEDVSQSPTITSPAVLTGVGMILGTAAYMAPEQARGKTVDKRADIWAFGAVLFEMLAGKRAFEDEDVSMTLSKVLQREPDFDALPPSVPARVRQALRVCLRKDPKQRAGDIRDVRLALEGVFETAIPQAAPPVRMPPWQRVATHAGAALAATVIAIAGTAVWFTTRTVTVPPPRVSRLLITPPSAAALATLSNVAITPDGTRVVYGGTNGTALFVRALDQLDATALTGLGLPTTAFVSPDGRWIGFGDTSTNTLKKVAITGGPAVTLGGVNGTLRGATWAPDDTIVFATSNTATGLHRIAAGGGEPTVLTRPDGARGEADHLWPEFLPGGQAVLFTITATTGGLDQAQIAVLDLRTGTQTTLFRGGSDARYVPSGLASPKRAQREGGHLVYGAAGTLRAVAFDLARLAVVGTAVPVVPQVVTTGNGGVGVAVAGDGTLVYAPGVGEQRTLVWVDRQGGQETPIAAAPREYDHPRISPDGARVAVHSNDEDLEQLKAVRVPCPERRSPAARGHREAAAPGDDGKRLHVGRRAGLASPVQASDVAILAGVHSSGALPADLARRLTTLGDALARVSAQIEFAYLFGSAATGRLTPRSDVDVAIHVAKEADSHAIRLATLVAVTKHLGTDAVEVVLLNAAPIAVAGRVLTSRQVLLDRAPLTRHLYESATVRLFQDFRIHEHRLLAARYTRG